MARGYWTCQRVTGGVRCGHINANRVQKCGLCAKRRPPRKRPAHMAALEQDYQAFIELNGGEHCGICGATRAAHGRRLDRDHDHRSGKPRGLLCHRCNRNLGNWVTPEWLRAAAMYLERARGCLPAGRYVREDSQPPKRLVGVQTQIDGKTVTLHPNDVELFYEQP